MATSPNPSDSLDALFTKMDALVESNPLNLRKKRDREESDIVRSSIPVQHCCSTRNLRIGSGFIKQPDNLVKIIDEDVDDDDDDGWMVLLNDFD